MKNVIQYLFSKKHYLLCGVLWFGLAGGGASLKAQTPADTLAIYEYLKVFLDQAGLKKADLKKDSAFNAIVRDYGLDMNRLLPGTETDDVSNPIPDSAQMVENHLLLLGKAYGDSIVLRWAPDNRNFWRQVNQAGYRLMRYTMNPDSLTVVAGSELVLSGKNEVLIRPWALDTIEATLKDADTLAWVVVQGLYGESGDSSNNLVVQDMEADNYYGFTMLCADRSALAAQVAGLRWVDYNIERGKSYLYVLSSPADTNAYAQGITSVRNLPVPDERPVNIIVIPRDGLANILWSNRDNGRFSAFLLERSEDGGKTFHQLHQEPLVFAGSDAAREPNIWEMGKWGNKDFQLVDLNNYYQYQDSLPQNYQEYTYRLRGINPFAEISQPAIFTGSGRDLTPPANPNIMDHAQLADGRARLQWYNEKSSDLKGFQVLLSDSEGGVYKPVTEQLLPPETDTYLSPQPLEAKGSHYYKVRAFDTHDNSSDSYPVYVHVVDSMPPAPPVNIRHFIDSTGVVTMVWAMGKEEDLAGYRVYFTNRRDYEMTQLTVEPTTYNFFRDTIEIKTLTETIYYAIQAVDRNYNRSAFSELIEVKKPDVIAPVTPVMRYPEVSDSSVTLHWTPSSSIDVVQHTLYRRLYDANEPWAEVRKFGRRDSTYTDNTVKSEKMYEYTLQAKDDAGLLSAYAFPVHARPWFDGEILSVKELQVSYDSTAKAMQLQWQFTPPNNEVFKGQDYRFYVYKSFGSEPLARYQQVERNTLRFADQDVRREGKYNYAVVVMFKNGKTSDLSSPVSARYFKK